MIYAPVIIPTLNRFEHFQKCIESLEKCSGADKTEVYVGLDFPPAEKYVAGWQKIDEYLSIKEHSNKFKKLTVFRRETNCGVGNPQSNTALLRMHIESFSDCFIYTEDDNIFSPNFLEFINKGLEKFKDDPSIYTINGYCHYPLYKFKSDDNNFFFHNTDYSAWGCGVWVEKRNRIIADIKKNAYFEKNFRWKIAIDIYRNHGGYRCIQYFAACFSYGWMRMHDGVYSVYMQVKGMNVVVPTVSKVRNMGWDSSGQSFAKGIGTKYQSVGNKHQQQEIDSEKTFDYVGNPWCYYDYNNKLAAAQSVNNKGFFATIFEVIKIIVKYYIKRIVRYKK